MTRRDWSVNTTLTQSIDGWSWQCPNIWFNASMVFPFSNSLSVVLFISIRVLDSNVIIKTCNVQLYYNVLFPVHFNQSGLMIVVVAVVVFYRSIYSYQLWSIIIIVYYGRGHRNENCHCRRCRCHRHRRQQLGKNEIKTMHIDDTWQNRCSLRV